MPGTPRPLHVSLVAIPDAVISTLTGIYDVLGSFRMLGRLEPSIPEAPPFTIEIVATERGNVALASGVPVEARRSVSEIAATDIIIVPSVLLGPDGWTPGRYPEIVDWARRMHSGWRTALLGLLGCVPARRDRALRRSGGDGSLGLRRRVCQGVPGRTA